LFIIIAQLPAHKCIPEPELIFHPERQQDRHIHPLVGLVNYGPYSRSLVNHVLDPIRLGVIAPHGGLQAIDRLLNELEQRHKPRERTQYLIEYPGFSRVFGLRVIRLPNQECIELPSQLDQEIMKSERPNIFLAETITKALISMSAKRDSFDLLLIYLPLKWQDCFYGSQDEDFNLHDYFKAIGASYGMPLQILREDRVMNYACRCSVMWRLGTAIYCKAGGVPWKLADSDPDVAYIGISYAIRMTDGTPTFITCCSQVFDSDGAGMEFLLYEPDNVHLERDNPFLSQVEMRRVMARSLALYQRRHSGQIPKRVVIHKSTEFKKEEADGCFEAWKATEGLELIQIQQNVNWRGVLIEQPRNKGDRKGVPSLYPCSRGSYLQISGRDVLLWTQGNSSSVVGGKNYYKEGKSIPEPLLLCRFAGHGTWDEGCRNVLGLTKMNWNNDGLYDRLPVTMGYASILARTIKRMNRLAPRPYQLRYFM
jgi:hypothetical protein